MTLRSYLLSSVPAHILRWRLGPVSKEQFVKVMSTLDLFFGRH